MMKILSWIVCAILFPVIVAPVAGAGDFDGTRPLLISVIRVVECTPDAACREVTPASVDLPQFLKIDFANKTIGPAAADDETPPTTIERQEVVDGKLILQGAEDGYEKMRDGLGWTIAISEVSGHVVLTASGDQVAFVVFGASLPL
ncbi:MAG: hypothetical protein P8X90_22690 [Desulfobacterales bacterium]|jgi:hypothetical protein